MKTLLKPFVSLSLVGASNRWKSIRSIWAKTMEQPNVDSHRMTINVPTHGKATVIPLHMS